ncbi:hypothetical protein, partial [Bifidobacterium rousetti]|uniref:hypothetical protein n=1 Tax=Bifidobacterium rousetti TaxID=2045439 RepID=UPI001CC2A569
KIVHRTRAMPSYLKPEPKCAKFRALSLKDLPFALEAIAFRIPLSGGTASNPLKTLVFKGFLLWF